MTLGILIVITLIFAFRGYRKGGQKILARLIALISGYTGALQLTVPAVAQLYRNGDDPGIVIYAVTALAIMGTLYLACYWLVHTLAYTIEEEEKPWAGAILNGLFGAAVGLVAVWGSLQVLAPLPEQQNRFEQFASQTVGSALGGLVDVYFANLATASNSPEPINSPEHINSPGPINQSTPSQLTQNLAKAVITQPGKAAQQINAVNQSGLLQRAFNDSAMQTLMTQGEINQLKQTELVQQLSESPAMRSLMQDGQLIQADSSELEVRHALSATMTEVWQRTSQIKDSDEFHSIVNDPDFQAALHSKNPLHLLSHSRFKELTQLVMQGDYTPKLAAGARLQPPGPPSQVYKWRDAEGIIHYTDAEPPAGVEILSVSP